MIVLSALVDIVIPINLFIFLEVCIKFAQMDIVGGEDIIANNLTFYPTEPVNAAFDFFGVGDKNMISNSGSYFFILAGIIGFSLFKAFVNWLATKIASNHYVRLMGMWAYQDQFLFNCSKNTVKLFMEEYFGLVFAVSVNLLAFEIF